MTDITIVTYNTLAQRWVGPYVEERYSYISNLQYLSWYYRRLMIIKDLITLDRDIICLQEIELNTFKDDFSDLLINYDYFRHTIVKKVRTNPVGNVILWKKYKFNCEETMQKSSAIFIVLKYLDKKIKIANVHLKAGREQFEKERVNQLKSTLKENPDIICGDFNDEIEENGLLYPLVIENYLVPIRQKTTSVYFAKNNIISHKFWAFDHIIVRNSIENMVNKTDSIEMIPNKNNPSDHVPLCSIITLISI